MMDDAGQLSATRMPFFGCSCQGPISLSAMRTLSIFLIPNLLLVQMVLCLSPRLFSGIMEQKSLPATTVRRMMMSQNNAEKSRTTSSLPPIPKGCHRVVLMRHGESEFNNANIFTGWCDVALTQRGIVEAMEAGQVFRSHEMTFSKCYTSVLSRSIVTAQRALETAGISYTPLEYDWRWNERHYGALQGLSKERTATRLGTRLVMSWRRSYAARPPLMRPGHPHHDTITQDERYKGLNIPQGESLADCQKRVKDAWESIVPDFGDGAYSLVVAHANTLRSLVMHLDEIPENQIEGLNIPTAIPFFYDINCTTGEIVSPMDSDSFSGIYISNERNKRNFLERRRAANDPWVWALHDYQVERSMLLEEGQPEDEPMNDEDAVDTQEALELLEQEARSNNESYSVVSYW